MMGYVVHMSPELHESLVLVRGRRGKANRMRIQFQLNPQERLKRRSIFT